MPVRHGNAHNNLFLVQQRYIRQTTQTFGHCLEHKAVECKRQGQKREGEKEVWVTKEEKVKKKS